METKSRKSSWIKILEIAPNKIKNLVRIIYALYLEILAPALGAWKEVEEPIKKTVKVSIFSILTLIAVFLVAFFGKLQGFTCFVLFSAATASLIVWSLGSKIGTMIAKVSGYKAVEKMGKEVKKLFAPLGILAAMLSFVTAMIAIWGFNSIWTSQFSIIFYVVGFLLTLATVRGGKIEKLYNTLNWIVMGSVILYALNVAFPATVESWGSYASTLNQEWNFHRDNETGDRKADIAVTEAIALANVFPLYHADTTEDGELIKLHEKTTGVPKGEVVQIMQTKGSAGKTFQGELFVQIRVKDPRTDRFTGGEVYWVQPDYFQRRKIDVNPDQKYSVVKKRNHGREIWEVHFNTDEEIRLKDMPVGKKFSFSGFTKGELKCRDFRDGNISDITPRWRIKNCPPTMKLRGYKGLVISIAFS